MGKISLLDVMPVPRKVSTGNGDLVVKGLDLQSIAILISEHGTLLGELLSNESVDFSKIVVTAPDLVATIICMATNTEGEEAIAKSFPVWLQIEALTAIWEETVPDLKKLTSLLSEAAKKITSQRKT